MSYCRWSSNHFECDVYVYEDVMGGWTTHIAGRKRKHKLPDEIKAMYPNVFESSSEEFVEKYEIARAAEKVWMKTLPHEEGESGFVLLLDDAFEDLPPPHAGKTYNHPSPGLCAEFLKELATLGFHVPSYAIEALLEEQEQLDEGDE